MQFARSQQILLGNKNTIDSENSVDENNTVLLLRILEAKVSAWHGCEYVSGAQYHVIKIGEQGDSSFIVGLEMPVEQSHEFLPGRLVSA